MLNLKSKLSFGCAQWNFNSLFCACDLGLAFKQPHTHISRRRKRRREEDSNPALSLSEVARQLVAQLRVFDVRRRAQLEISVMNNPSICLPAGVNAERDLILSGAAGLGNE